MTKVFSVVSWNVKHFKGEKARVETVVELLQDQNPDVFALYHQSQVKHFNNLSRMDIAAEFG